MTNSAANQSSQANRLPEEYSLAKSQKRRKPESLVKQLTGLILHPATISVIITALGGRT